jgi:NTE family protein
MLDTRPTRGNDGAPLALHGKNVVLFLQGGGALGAYQVGAFRALAEACRRERTSIGWVAGISIGAVNAAIIAAPRNGDPSTELESLWNELLSPRVPPYDVTATWESLPSAMRSGWLAPLMPKYANWAWEAFNPRGQRHFFGSRVLSPAYNPWFRQWFGPLTPEELAFYDTAELRKTLDRHVDWAAIGREGAVRLSLGATRVYDGEVTFFDSFGLHDAEARATPISADHVLASAALPPAFPAISIAGEFYWDGGVASNTPITVLADELTSGAVTDTIVFLVDLWDRKGPVPNSMDAVTWRQKSIAYGSRKEAAVEVVNAHQHDVDARTVPPVRLEVVQVMFETPRDATDPQFAFADADFTQQTYARMVRLGFDDMHYALEHPHRVPGVGGDDAILYRHGTHGKHRETDGKYAAARERKARRMREFRATADAVHDDFSVREGDVAHSLEARDVRRP